MFAIEVLKPEVSVGAGGRPCAGRRNKLTQPVFVTPGGVIDAFPTSADDYFTSPPLMPVLPVAHPRIPEGSGWAIISRIDLERSARYVRWLHGKREDTRTTLDDSHAMFVAEGRAGLKKRFSKTHVFYLLREFKKRGWNVE